MGKKVSKAFKSVTKSPIKTLGKGLGTVFTAGLNQTNLGGGVFKKLGNTVGDALTLGTAGLSKGKPGAPNLVNTNGMSPTDMLAQSGGAPLLANIAMGVDPEEALAGYFGKSKADGSWEEFLGTVNEKDFASINSTFGQLKTIQGSRELRQKAVDNVMADFPNVAKQAAQARMEAGGEFDEVTKGYMQQALSDTAARYGFGGNLSSGAANEAFSKVGAGMAMNKLDYMGQREQNKYQQESNVMNARLAEVNALRDFQNTMLGGQINQGFSAQQANLQRQMQGQMFNAEQMNQQRLSDQASKNSMFGAVGSLAGTAIGAYFGGPFGAAAGGSMGGSLFGSPSPKVSTPSFMPMPPPSSSSQYAPYGVSGY